MKTIFSFDGGGVRGALTIAFWEEIERILKDKEDTPLVKRVDLAGGCSTGALLAALFALGYSASESQTIFSSMAPKVFQRSRSRIPGIQSKFKGNELKKVLNEICGDKKLESPDLLTGFMLAMKRMDTGSPWILSNNPNNPYWDDPPDGSYLGNRHYLLSDIIRASTAAPHFFEPELIKIMDGQPPGLFVDGGVSVNNNPAFALLRLATIPSLGYSWETGIDKLRIVSFGTGSFRETMKPDGARRMPAAGLGVKALAGMMKDAMTQVITLMQLLGDTQTPWKIDSEIGDLSDMQWLKEPLFQYLRYDVRLEADWLKRELDIDVTESQLVEYRKMDEPKTIPELYELGKIAAKAQVKKEHFLTD